MSIAEMKEKKDKIITAIQSLSEDKLNSLEIFMNEISGKKYNDSIENIYEKAVGQYHETLQKLAQ